MSTRWGSKIFLLILMLQTMQPNRASPWSVSELASGGFGVIFRGCHLGVSHVFCLLQHPATPMLILRGATWLASCNPFWTESNPGQETQPWAINTSDRNNVAKSPQEKRLGRVLYCCPASMRMTFHLLHPILTSFSIRASDSKLCSRWSLRHVLELGSGYQQ